MRGTCLRGLAPYGSFEVQCSSARSISVESRASGGGTASEGIYADRFKQGLATVLPGKRPSSP